FNALTKEAAADRALTNAGVAPAERGKVTSEVAKAGVEIQNGPKTQIAKTAGGKQVLVVRNGATAGEIHQVLKEVKPPAPKEPPTSFVPVDKPLPGSPQERLSRTVNSQVSERVKSKLGEIHIEIVPEGGFGPSKTRAEVVHVE